MKRILCAIMVVALLAFPVTGFAVDESRISASNIQGGEETDYLQYYKGGKYEQYFTHYLSYFNISGYAEDTPGPVYILRDYGYEELFEYYSRSSDSSLDESLPNYVLVKGFESWEEEQTHVELYGDYVVKTDKTNVALYNPFADGNGYYIIIPGDDLHYKNEIEVIPLRMAYDNRFDGIEAVFQEYGLGYLMGDANNDHILNIKDATEIQKCLAGINEFADYDELFHEESEPLQGAPRYISDFNRDGQRNIKDATAIQKKIAGLPWM